MRSATLSQAGPFARGDTFVQHATTTRYPRHHRANRYPHSPRDICVTEFFDVAHPDGVAERFWHRLERRLYTWIDRIAKELLFRRRVVRDVCVSGACDVILVHQYSRTPAISVIVLRQVRQDGTKPRAQVRAWSESIGGLKGVQIGVLYEIVGFSSIR
jgi:hypothetical protein